MNCALNINFSSATNLKWSVFEDFCLEMNSRDIEVHSRLEYRLKLWTLQGKRSQCAHKEIALNTKQSESPTIK